MRFGNCSRWNASFEEMTCSIPGISGPCQGAAPVETRMWRWRGLCPRAGDSTIRGASCGGARRGVGGGSEGVGVGEHGPALDQVDVGALERRRIGELEAGDLAILVGDQLAPIEDRLLDRPAVPRRVLEIVGETRGIDEQL